MYTAVDIGVAMKLPVVLRLYPAHRGAKLNSALLFGLVFTHPCSNQPTWAEREPNSAVWYLTSSFIIRSLSIPSIDDLILIHFIMDRLNLRCNQHFNAGLLRRNGRHPYQYLLDDQCIQTHHGDVVVKSAIHPSSLRSSVTTSQRFSLTLPTSRFPSRNQATVTVTERFTEVEYISFTATHTKSSAAFIGVCATTKTISVTDLSVSTSLQTFSNPTAYSHDGCHKTPPAVIAGAVIGSLLGSVAVVVLLFVLWRRKYRKRVSNDTGGDNDPGMTSIPNPTLTPISISSTHFGPIESIASESDAISRRLSQSSRTAYEEEIQQLRQRIRYMEEEVELTYSSSAPPSYRSSRRSEASDPFGPSSSPPPPLPSRELPR
ncbi:hypothetical protein IW261DRAFT_1594565 [Armillaria novae-zelandiae]|uniref:Uncharacterized protein n=1 Tax=Armillaria novae-zelandiae TaxID=153914 RepID=A0AA39U8W2_9AGAR|nr:hypothetical protein IW261DRAFT_1594565 [Armillaria novae-zelandiae]